MKDRYNKLYNQRSMGNVVKKGISLCLGTDLLEVAAN